MGGNDRSSRGESRRRGRSDGGVRRVLSPRRDTVHEQPGIDRHELPGTVLVGEYHSYVHADRWHRTDAPLSGEYDIDWLATDEWLAYDVHVRESGPYDLTAHVAAADSFGGGAFRIDVDDDPVERVSFDPTGGWYSWEDVETIIELPEGVHRLQVVVVEGGWKLHHLRFE